jgi:ribosome-binding protein aMBF1 (putative translation factor)
MPETKPHERVIAEQLQDPAVEQEWQRTALARAVAMRLVAYRAEHGLSQTKLARLLGMKQPAVARLEAGDHVPTLLTLTRLSQALGMEFHIDITPTKLELTA